MKEILLSKGKKTIVDDEMFDVLNQWKWYASASNPGRFYALRQFRKLDGKISSTCLHHSVMGFPLRGKQIDHINGDTLDNRRENLRIVSRRENMSNMKQHRNGRTLGVYKLKNRWLANVWINGKTIHIGTFLSEKDAIDSRAMEIERLKEKYEQK